MREIILDTETTGLNPETGDRIVEIGCIELVNSIQTERLFHAYLNPERDMPVTAYEVHGLSTEFLADKPLFGDLVEDFLEFIADDRLVIHNAEFDIRFLNAELARVDRPVIQRHRVFDTLELARRKFPGERASLDALCRRFGIDLSSREKHGALLDAELLSLVYIELTGGRHGGLALAPQGAAREDTARITREFREPRAFPPSAEERRQHDEMLDRITDPLWRL